MHRIRTFLKLDQSKIRVLNLRPMNLFESVTGQPTSFHKIYLHKRANEMEHPTNSLQQLNKQSRKWIIFEIVLNALDI